MTTDHFTSESFIPTQANGRGWWLLTNSKHAKREITVEPPYVSQFGDCESWTVTRWLRSKGMYGINHEPEAVGHFDCKQDALHAGRALNVYGRCKGMSKPPETWGGGS